MAHDHDDHDHHHHHDHDHGSELSETQIRVRALETILTEKGYVDPAALEPADRDLRDQGRPAQRRARHRQGLDRSGLPQALLADATPADRDGRLCGPPGRAHLVAVENTPKTPQHGRLHAVLLLPVAGARPAAGLVQGGALPLRAVNDPRGVLEGFRRRRCRPKPKSACGIPPPRLRYLVLPMRPAGTEGWSEEKLAALVTRDSMIGTGLPKIPGVRCMNGGQDMGGVHGIGPVEAGAERAGVSRRMGKARLRADARDGRAGRLEHRHVALRAREPSARRISVDDLLPDLARRRWKS